MHFAENARQHKRDTDRLQSMRKHFILSSDECETLLAFETSQSLEKLAAEVGRDPSVVSRTLTKIAAKIPAVEKKMGRWVLTEMGRTLNSQTRDSIQFQQTLFERQQTLRIGTNREFAARVFAPELPKILELFPKTIITLNSYESGTENALLHGQIDIGFDCDRPFDPDISYKLIVAEPIIAVCTPKFFHAHRVDFESHIFRLPHLLCDRLSPNRILSTAENRLNVIAAFNDIASTRRACETGVGWALLPQYAVRSELDKKSLVEIPGHRQAGLKYGVWWLRRRPYLQPQVKVLTEWMKTIEL